MFTLLAGLASLLAGICAIGAVICFVLVIIKMFTNDDATIGIVCLIGLFCGFGYLVAFIRGWMKAGDWGAQNIMYGWTGCIVGTVIFAAVAAMFGGGG